MTTHQQAKCENCGTIFTLNVNGVTTSDGHDLCDDCNHTVRNVAGQVIDQSHSSKELIARLIERIQR